MSDSVRESNKYFLRIYCTNIVIFFFCIVYRDHPGSAKGIPYETFANVEELVASFHGQIRPSSVSLLFAQAPRAAWLRHCSDPNWKTTNIINVV
jgi:hypothetical protein